MKNWKGAFTMSKKIIAVALDINKIPYINDNEIILTLGHQKIWYTTNTLAIEVPNRIKIYNDLLNRFMRKFMKKSTKHDLIQFNYFANKVADYIDKNSYDEIIFENNQLRNKILPNFKNKNEYVAHGSSAQKKEAVSSMG